MRALIRLNYSRYLWASLVIGDTFVFKSVAPENFSWHVWSPNLKMGYYLNKRGQTPAFKVSTKWQKNKCVSKYLLININPNFSRDASLPGIKIKMKTHWDWVWKITIQRSGGFNFSWTLRKFYSWTCQNQLHSTIRICISYLDRVPGLWRRPLEGENHLKGADAAGKLPGGDRPQRGVRVNLVSQHRGPEHLEMCVLAKSHLVSVCSCYYVRRL